MDQFLMLAADPTVWIALATLIVMEVVLGIDNLVFISILTNKLPESQRSKARKVGIGFALVTRLALLGTISFIVGLTAPVFTILDEVFSWRDMVLIAGGLFLVWKATHEIHNNVDPDEEDDTLDKTKVGMAFGTVIVQILALDLVFSLDSIITAVGMTDHLPVMMIAVIVAVLAMLLAADPLSEFIHRNPTVVMLALGFLLLIGTTLIADGFGFHVPKGYIYAAMAFSGFVEVLNTLSRRRKKTTARG